MSRIYGIILSVGALVVALDQWTKHLVLERLTREGDSHPVWSWFSFTLVYNRGAAFGIFRDMPESIRSAFFIILPIAVLAFLWGSYVRRFNPKELLAPISIGLVVGGAIGNLIDRLRQGYVTDFIDWFYPSSTGTCIPLFHRFMPAPGCHWPVFNIADSAISIAIVLLLVYSFAFPSTAKK